MTHRTPALVAWITLIVSTVVPPLPALAEDALPVAVPAAAPCITTYRTTRFVLHTDLAFDAARRTLEQMEETLEAAARYFHHEPRGRIECYVARDIDAWPRGTLPHPLARVLIDRIGGATLSAPDGRRGQLRVTVYAFSGEHAEQHEVVHAFCCNCFGETGPDWFKEGIAETLALSPGRHSGVCCPPLRLIAIKAKAIPSPFAIARNHRFMKATSESLQTMLTDHGQATHAISLDKWTSQNDADLAGAQLSYDWSWALCHLLVHHSAYRERFQLLGNGYLTGQEADFERMFSPRRRQLEFEFAQFVKNVEQGYRVDLCEWDWDRQATELEPKAGICRRVVANRGYQATGLRVRRDRRYSYQSHGTWTADPSRSPTDADGDEDGHGRLVAVVMNDYELSEPFHLGVKGSFVAPDKGQLYVRCQDDWGQLADNEGEVTITLRRRTSNSRR